MSAQRLHFSVKIWRNGRSEFPTDVPKFQLNSKTLLCPQGETSGMFTTLSRIFLIARGLSKLGLEVHSSN